MMFISNANQNLYLGSLVLCFFEGTLTWDFSKSAIVAWRISEGDDLGDLIPYAANGTTLYEIDNVSVMGAGFSDGRDSIDFYVIYDMETGNYQSIFQQEFTWREVSEIIEDIALFRNIEFSQIEHAQSLARKPKP